MALESMGLGATLTFNAQQAIRASGQARDAMGRFIQTTDRGPQSFSKFSTAFEMSMQKVVARARQVASGVKNIGDAFRNATLALAPLSIGVFAGVKKAADFEKQMSGVGAITRATEKDFAALTAEAKRLGVESVFSATQSGEAMEYLGRAGAKPAQIIDALGGVMAAAAADSIDLATSADIVAQVVRGMNMEWKEASHVADVLALTSARSNTNIVALGESFKYGVSQAKSMGISMEETAAVFGKLADAGLRGSLGGTAFTNMLVKLAKPTSQAKKYMRDFGVTLTDVRTGKLKPLGDIVDQFSSKLNRIKSATKRAEIASHVFGIRGARAYNALAVAGGKALGTLQKELIQSSFGIGAAQEMAERRLDNFMGRFTLLMSSIESVSIETFGPMLKLVTRFVEDATEGLNQVLFTIQKLKGVREAEGQAASESARISAEGMAKQLKLGRQLGEAQGARAETALATVSRMLVGEEDLSRGQRKARADAFGSFMEQALKESKMSKRLRAQRISDAWAIAKAGTAEGASREKVVRLQQELARVITSSGKQSKKMGIMDQAQRNMRIGTMVREAAARAKIEGEAKKLIAREKTLDEINKKYGPTVMAIAEGVLEAIDSIKAGMTTISNKVRELGQRFSNTVGPERIKQIAKIGTIFAVVAGASVPLLVMLGLVAFFIKGVLVPLITGAISVLSAVFWPVVIVVGVVMAALTMLRKENETLGQTASRVWGEMKAWAIDFYTNAILPFWYGFKTRIMPVIDELGVVWNETMAQVKEVFNSVLGDLFAGSDGVETDWVEVGRTVADVIGVLGKIAITVFGGILMTAIVIGRGIYEVFKSAWDTLDNLFRRAFDGILDIMEGNFLRGMAKIGVAIFDTIAWPIRILLKGILKLANAIGFDLPDWMKGLQTFADEGLGELIWPTQEGAKSTVNAIKEAKKAAGKGVKTTVTADVINLARRKAIQEAGVKPGKGRMKAVASIMQEKGLEGVEGAKVAKRIMELRAEEAKAKKKPPEVKAEVSVEDKRQLDITNRMCVSGRDLNVASADHKRTLLERSGAKSQPWRRQVAVEHGLVR